MGSHSTPGLGPKVALYDGSDQILLEKASPPSIVRGHSLYCSVTYHFSQLDVPFTLIQTLALATMKLSLLFLYRRLFRGRAFKITNWVLIGVVVIWAITFVILILSACGTRFRAWFQTLLALKEECGDAFTIFLALSVFDVAVDLAILILPIPLVKQLEKILLFLDMTHTYLGCGIANAVTTKDRCSSHLNGWDSVSKNPPGLRRMPADLGAELLLAESLDWCSSPRFVVSRAKYPSSPE